MRGVFFVINHVSYLDGVVASCLSPLVFIGRSDLKTWPLFGALTSLSDTIFVDRIDYSNIHRELGRIISMLNNKINVILFPEGTSTDGSKLLPFKTSFFDAPLKAGCKVVPLAIKYVRVNSEQVTEGNRDSVYWYGDMYFLPHLLGVMKLKSIEVEVKVFKPLSAGQVFGGNHSLRRKYLGGTCQELIENYLNLEKAGS